MTGHRRFDATVSTPAAASAGGSAPRTRTTAGTLDGRATSARRAGTTTGAASTHEWRVRRMQALASGSTIVLALGWALYFASRGQWLVVAMNIIAAACSAGSHVLGRRHHPGGAMALLFGTVFVAIFLSAAFLDLPSPTMPRGMHEFFLALGVGACLTLRTARPWIRTGFPLACFAAYTFFAGANPVWRTEYAVPEDVRAIGVWLDHLVALAVTYLAVQVIQNDATERNALEVHLRDALLRDEFELHFQPQVDASGRTFAAEALVRWRHPVRGLVYPNDFIPIAERAGLMGQIGDRVLRSACRQLAAWSHDPALAHLQLAVNVSAAEFAEPGFERRVLDAVHGAGVHPSRLKLELTESMLADDIDDMIAKMSALRAAGIAFSLDDFGTGFSSLAYLHRLPIDQLKIDQAFVRNMEASDKDATIVKAVLTLGTSLGLQVIAEGVETETHRRLLTEAGCGMFQGYLFSRPVPAASFANYVRASYAERMAVAGSTADVELPRGEDVTGGEGGIRTLGTGIPYA